MPARRLVEDEYSYPPSETEGAVKVVGVYGATAALSFTVRESAVVAFLDSLDGLTEDDARAKFRADKGVNRWNAATQQAILRGIREMY